MSLFCGAFKKANVHEKSIWKTFFIVKAFENECLSSQAQNLKGPSNDKSKAFVNKHYESLEFFKENKNKKYTIYCNDRTKFKLL